jgi:hypothetical protein
MAVEQQPPRQLAKRAQMARYTVSVDGQLKSSYDTRDAAETEAKRILSKFPILTVTVADSENDSAKLLGATHAKIEPEDADEGEDGEENTAAG